MRNVALIVGSLRKGSFTRQIGNVLIEQARPLLHIEPVEIADLALYNPDCEDHPPRGYLAFRQRIREVDGVLFATPEYNRSIPGALKNAIDVGSRPYGHSAWTGKPAAVVSVSPGALGAFGAHHHLRQCLVFLDMPCMQQPEAYVGNVAKAFDDSGRLINEGTRDFLHRFVVAFADWITRLAEPRVAHSAA